MSNSYNSNPIVLDTDMASGWKASQTLSTNPVGLLVYKITIVSSGTSGSAGNLSVTDPNDGTVLYPSVSIASSSSATGLVLYFDNIAASSLAWRDFKVTGLTSTQTKMFIWYRA